MAWTALLLALCAAPAQRFDVGDTVELPGLAGPPRDHATVAMNDAGDVFVAWHAERPDGRKQVAGIVATRLANGRLELRGPLLLGDPALDLVGTDTCRKPDVVALRDGSFCVAWPRSDAQDRDAAAWVEAARVRVRNGGGQPMQPVVDGAGAGRGIPVDPSVVPGDGGIMPDLAAYGALGTARCAVVYASESERSVWFGDLRREYALRAVELDWEAGTATLPQTLESGIPVDERADAPLVGGLVLPDAVADADGHLVVAHEEYHLGLFRAFDAGRIVVARYRAFGSPQELERMDRTVLGGATDAAQQRRPNLHFSLEDGLNAVSLAWNDRPRDGGAERVAYVELRYALGAPGVTGPFVGYWVERAGAADGFPVPLRTADAQLCLAVRESAGVRRLTGSMRSLAGQRIMAHLPAPLDRPWRPALAHRAAGPGHGAETAVVHEDADAGSPEATRIFLTVYPD